DRASPRPSARPSPACRRARSRAPRRRAHATRRARARGNRSRRPWRWPGAGKACRSIPALPRGWLRDPIWTTSAEAGRAVHLRAGLRSSLHRVLARHQREAAEIEDIGELGLAGGALLVAAGEDNESGADCERRARFVIELDGRCRARKAMGHDLALAA